MLRRYLELSEREGDCLNVGLEILPTLSRSFVTHALHQYGVTNDYSSPKFQSEPSFMHSIKCLHTSIERLIFAIHYEIFAKI